MRVARGCIKYSESQKDDFPRGEGACLLFHSGKVAPALCRARNSASWINEWTIPALFCLYFDETGMVVHDSPAIRLPLEYQAEHSPNIARAAVQMPLP